MENHEEDDYTRHALQLLERIQKTLYESHDMNQVSLITEDLGLLIAVLESPVFQGVLAIQNSLMDLKYQIHRHPSILPADFDISSITGELILSVRPAIQSSMPPVLNTIDPYDSGYDYEDNRIARMSDVLATGDQTSKRKFTTDSSLSNIEASQYGDHKDTSEDLLSYSQSSIATYSYTLELQKAVEEAAQGREIIQIQLCKPDGSSLGFSVVGLKSEQRGELGIFIQEIQPHGVTARDSRLQEGDQILAIDGQPLDSNISHQQAISILQQARGLVDLVVARGGAPTPAEPSPTTSLDRPASAISETSKASDMVLNTEWAQVEVMILINDGTGLGFGIIGGRSTGVVVKTILPGGVADKDGRLQSGDHILQIGDVNLRGMGSEQVASVLRQSGSHVRLVVARPVEPTSPDYQIQRDVNRSAPIVPTRILSDPDELERHLTILGNQNQFIDPSVYSNFELYGTNFVFDQAIVANPSTFSASAQHADVELHPIPLVEIDQEVATNHQTRFEVELTKGEQGLGITIAGYVCEKGCGTASDEISGIFVKSITPGSAAQINGSIHVNDQIVEVDGRSLQGYTNHEAVEVLRNTGKVVRLSLIQYLRGPKYDQLQQAIAAGNDIFPLPTLGLLDKSKTSEELDIVSYKVPFEVEPTASTIGVDALDMDICDNYGTGDLDPAVEASICAMWEKILGPEFKIVVSKLTKFSEGELGISLEGTVDIEDGLEVRPHHYIRSILPNGPVGLNGRLQSGDELLEVNGIRLYGHNHKEVVMVLKELPIHVNMVCARRIGTSLPISMLDSSVPKLDVISIMPSRSMSTIPQVCPLGAASATPGTYGGSLQNLMTVTDRLFKAKSDGSLSVTAGAGIFADNSTFSKMKSRSLEPLTRLAMWASEPQIIELLKGERGLGFSILDYQDPMNASDTIIVIRSLVPGGVAQQDGRIIPGDRLMFVNNVNLENASLDNAVQTLKGAPKGVVKIGIAKPLPLAENVQTSDQDNMFNGAIQQLSIADPSDLSTFVSFREFSFSECNPSASSPCPSPIPSLSFGQLGSDLPLLPTALERTVKIKKGGDHLGLNLAIIGNGINGAMLRSVDVGGAIAKNDCIQQGDYILSINNESLRRITNSQARAIMRRAELVSTDICVTYIPASDADIFFDSTLMALGQDVTVDAPNYPVCVTPTMLHSHQISPSTKHQERHLKQMEDPDQLISPLSPLPPIDNSQLEITTLVSPFMQSQMEDNNVNEDRQASTNVEENIPHAITINPLEIFTLQSPHFSPEPLTDNEPVKPTNELAFISPEVSHGSMASSQRRMSDVGNQCVLTTPSPLLDEVRPKSAISVASLSKAFGMISEPGDEDNSSQSYVSSASSNVPQKVCLSNISLPPVYSPHSLPATTTSQMISSPSDPKTPKNLETASTHGSQNILTAKAWGQERVVELLRDDNQSLGISIVGGKIDLFHMSPGNTITGIFIKNVLPESSAGKNGTLKTGDRILEVDGIDLREATHEYAVDIIKKSNNPVKFVVQSLEHSPRDIEDLESISSVSPESPVKTMHADRSEEDMPSLLKVTPINELGYARTPSPELLQIGVHDLEKAHDIKRFVLPSMESESDDYVEEVQRFTADDESTSHERAAAAINLEIKDVNNKSAAYLKMSPGDVEIEDDYGYTKKKIQKKYGDLNGELIVVDVLRGPNGLGLSLAGNKDRTKMSTFIVGLNPGGNAYRDGHVQVGDEILEVNGHVLHGRCHLNASAIIKGLSGAKLKIVLLRRREAIKELAVKPIIQFPVNLGDETIEERFHKYKSLRTISLRKGSQGLGIMIMEGKHTEAGQGIFISDIQAGSVAEQAGLVVGDMIISVNDDELISADYDAAANILKRAEGLIRVMVCNPSKPSNDLTTSGSGSLSTSTTPLADINNEKPAPPPKPMTLIHKLTMSASKSIAPSPTCMVTSVASTATSPSKPFIVPHKYAAPAARIKSAAEQLGDPVTCNVQLGRETTIEISKEKMGLGLSIVGGSDTLLGSIIIHEVYQDGAAAKDGRLLPGDQILEVNHENLREATHDTAIQALRQTPARVKMVVYRDDGQNKEEDTYDVFDVELAKKEGKGLGLSIVGRKNGPGIFISDVVKGGIAEADGRLMQGDQILLVNDQNLKTATQEQAAALLKTTMGQIRMKIGRLKAGSKRSSSRDSSPKPNGTSETTTSSPSKFKTISLEHGVDGLGFSIVGGFGSPHGDLPIYVKTVFDKGAAARNGQLKRGDQLVSVNEIPLEGLTHETAVAMLKNAKGNVTLVVIS